MNGVSEQMPIAPGEDLPGQEQIHQINEKVAEMNKRAAQHASGQTKEQKDEKKSKKRESSLSDFLLKCINSSILDDEIIDALNKVLKDNHSPHILIEGLSLIYNIQDIENPNTNTITLYEDNDIMNIEQWLLSVENASYEMPQRTLQNIEKHPESLKFFFEKILQTYIKLYNNTNISFDLVNMSQNIIDTLKKMINVYIQKHMIK